MDNILNKKNNDEEKNDFFMISAHELRTSLSAMKWLFKMLLEGDFGKLNESQTAMLIQATQSNDRMIKTVNDTMKIIKSGVLNDEYTFSSISLTELIDESIKEFTSEAIQKNMKFVYNAVATPILINGEADKIRIVLHNLFENAIKYGQKDSIISLSLRAESKEAIFSISNKGSVIPEEEKTNIFKKFFRSSNSEKEQSGVGLGLYATKQIVNKHFGKMSFENNSDGITTFTLTLPIIS